jgi:FAD-dependent oxidoreductase family protein
MAPKLTGYSCLKVEDLTAVEVASRRRMLLMLEFYSCDPASHTFLREVPVCWVMGQAAGVAAAVAVAAGLSPREVDATDVQRELRRQGAFLEHMASRETASRGAGESGT